MFIYRTINLMNGKVYVGKSIAKKTRLYLGSGKLLAKAIKKYGEENFMRRIMYYGETNEELNEQEKFWISKLREEYGSDKLYNIADGGQNPIMFGEKNGFYGRKHTEESRNKASKTFKNQFKNGRVVWNKGKKGVQTWSEESIKKMSVSVSKALKGIPKSEKHKANMRHPHKKGYKQTEAHKLAIKTAKELKKIKEL